MSTIECICNLFTNELAHKRSDNNGPIKSGSCSLLIHLFYFPTVRRTLGKKSDFDEITEALGSNASKDSNKESDV